MQAMLSVSKVADKCSITVRLVATIPDSASATLLSLAVAPRSTHPDPDPDLDPSCYDQMEHPDFAAYVILSDA